MGTFRRVISLSLAAGLAVTPLTAAGTGATAAKACAERLKDRLGDSSERPESPKI